MAFTQSEDGGVMIDGQASVNTFAIIVLRRALMTNIKTGMIMNRGYTVRKMLDAAERHTGKKYKTSAAQKQQAVDDLSVMLAPMSQETH